MHFSTIFSSQKGMTLIEILASILIISIIIFSLIPFFIQSSKTTNLSKNILDATYIAETEMEQILNVKSVSNSRSVDQLSSKLKNQGFKNDPACSNCLGINHDGHYVSAQLMSLSEELGKVVVRVYKNEKKETQEAQMEMIIQWGK